MRRHAGLGSPANSQPGRRYVARASGLRVPAASSRRFWWLYQDTPALPLPGGAVAAPLLSQLGPSAAPFLIAACKSSNATERVNASAGLGWPKDARFVEPLLNLL